MHLCGMSYKCFSPHCCKWNSFGCIAAIRCGNACHGPHSDSLYSGSEHSQFNPPRLVKHEAGFPNPRRALIDSNQLWHVNDSPYYREYPMKYAYGFVVPDSKDHGPDMGPTWVLLAPDAPHVGPMNLATGGALFCYGLLANPSDSWDSFEHILQGCFWLTRGQSYDCPKASEAILKDIGNIDLL